MSILNLIWKCKIQMELIQMIVFLCSWSPEWDRADLWTGQDVTAGGSGCRHYKPPVTAGKDFPRPHHRLCQDHLSKGDHMTNALVRRMFSRNKEPFRPYFMLAFISVLFWKPFVFVLLDFGIRHVTRRRIQKGGWFIALTFRKCKTGSWVRDR